MLALQYYGKAIDRPDVLILDRHELGMLGRSRRELGRTLAEDETRQSLVYAEIVTGEFDEAVGVRGLVAQLEGLGALCPIVGRGTIDQHRPLLADITMSNDLLEEIPDHERLRLPLGHAHEVMEGVFKRFLRPLPQRVFGIFHAIPQARIDDYSDAPLRLHLAHSRRKRRRNLPPRKHRIRAIRHRASTAA